MGNTIKVLVERKLKEASDIYPGMHTVERCEDFHLHRRNLRMIFDTEEFKIFCNAVRDAQNAWIRQGCPSPEPDKSLPDYLHNRDISPVHSRRSTDFAIEIQGDLPHMPQNMIHIHYKSLRLDVSHDEFIELAEAFSEALDEFKKWKKTK